MQPNISATYRNLVALPEHEFKIKATFQTDGAPYVIREDQIVAIKTTQQIISDFAYPIGNACVGECDIEILSPPVTFPRMGWIELEVAAAGYLNDVYTESEFIPKGTFFIDTREYGHYGQASTLIIHGYDSMLKAEALFPSVTSHGWPHYEYVVVDDILPILGVTLDNRTQWGHGSLPDFLIDLPAGFSCREVLEYIAVRMGGNWIITDANKLRLIPLNSLPEDSNFLIEERGNKIAFNGTRILLGGD